jgi:hypothetical protein
MNITYMPYPAGTPVAPMVLLGMTKTYPGVTLSIDPSSSRSVSSLSKEFTSVRLVRAGAWETRRKTTKRIAWGSFLAAIFLVSTAVFALFVGVAWLAALSGTASLAAYGLLYTAGMDLREIDQEPFWMFFE